MILTARILTDVGSVNNFKYTEAARFTEGDGQTVYFQLFDASVEHDLNPRGRRYMPASGATLQCVVQDIDNAKTITRYATQPYPLDPSIWSLTILPTDPMRGTWALKLMLTEGLQVTRGSLDGAMRVDAQVRAW